MTRGSAIPAGSAPPRVLLVTGAGVAANGNFGLTMLSLFGGWPDSHVASIFIGAPPAGPSAFENTFQSGLEGVWGYGLIRRVARKLTAPEEVVLRRSREGAHISADELDARTIANTYSILRAHADLLSYRLSKRALEWLDKYRPQVIVSPLESIRVMRLCLRVSKQYDVPIVPFFADDWPSTLYERLWLLAGPRAQLRRTLRLVMGHAPRGMAGSPAMATECSRRYGKPFATFVRSVVVPPEFLEPPGHTYSGLRAVYAGRLNCERWRALIDVGQAMSAAGLAGSALDVYCTDEDTSQYGLALRAIPTIRLRGSVPPRDVAARLTDYDVLVHVESFGPKETRYTRLSLSTKIPQYLASGRPILMYGPAGLSVTEYVRESGGGLVVDCQDSSSLIAALDRLAQSRDLRSRLGRAGWETARRLHDTEQVRDSFRDFISDCVSHDSSGRY